MKERSDRVPMQHTPAGRETHRHHTTDHTCTCTHHIHVHVHVHVQDAYSCTGRRPGPRTKMHLGPSDESGRAPNGKSRWSIRPSRSMEPGPVIAWRNGTRCANSGRAAMRRMTAAREIALYALRLYIPYKEQSILPPPQRVCAATVRNATTDPACAPPSGSADS